MRKSLGILFFIALLSISLLAGCSQGHKPQGDGADLIPAAANMIGHIRLSQVMADNDISAMYQALPGDTGDPQTLEEALAASMGIRGLDLSTFEEGWVFGDISQGADRKGYFAAILKGSYDENALLTDLASQGFNGAEYGGYDVYADPDQKAALAPLTDDLIVAGSMQAVKDVIAVKMGDEPSIGGELLATYQDLDDTLVKAAIAVPEGLIGDSLQTAAGGNPLLLSVIDILSSLQTVTLTMAKDGAGILCTSQLFFADNQAARNVKSLIQMAPQMMGSVEIPEGFLGENQEEILALAAALLGKSEASVRDTCLTVSFTVTAADLEAAFPQENSGENEGNGAVSSLAIDLAVRTGDLTSSGLGVSVDATITNSTAMAFDTGDLKMTAAGGSGQTYIQTTTAGVSIAANSSTTFESAILIPLGILGEKEFRIAVETTAGSTGISIPLSASVTLTLPSIESLIAVPDIDLTVDIGDLTAEGLDMALQTAITNANPFGLEIGDLTATVKGQSGNVITTSTMKGCSIAGNSTGALSGHFLLPLEVLNETTLVITLQTEAGFAAVKLPINARITVNMPDLESLIAVPDIDLTVDIGDLTAEGLDMALQTAITNANPFGLEIGDLTATVEGQSGNVITTSTIKGCSIAGNSSGTLSGRFLLPLEVLNENTLVITLQTEAGFAAVTLPISARITVNMPDLDNLIAIPGIQVYTGASWVPHFPLPQLRLAASSKITNNASLDLVIGDIHATFFDADGNLIAQMTIPGGQIEASSTRTFSGSVTLSASQYSKLFDADYFVVRVSAEAGISGVDATIPLEAVMIVAVSSLF